MLINKKQFRINNNKKILHKVGKRWVTMSILMLGLIGGVGVTSTITSHAASTQPSTQQTTKAVQSSTTPKNIMQSAKAMHANILATTPTSDKSATPTSNQSSVASKSTNSAQSNSTKSPSSATPHFNSAYQNYLKKMGGNNAYDSLIDDEAKQENKNNSNNVDRQNNNRKQKLIGTSDNGQDTMSDGHWIYNSDTHKYYGSDIAHFTKTGFDDGLDYKYDPTKKILEFTDGTAYSTLGNLLEKLDAHNSKSIKFDNAIDTSQVSDISNTFAGDSNLQSLDLGNHFDTSQVSNMLQMFWNDSNLQSLNLGNHFDTSKVTDMSSMFADDSDLQSLNLGNHFDTSKVTDMSSMFADDRDLQSLNLGNHFDTSKVTDMSSMFADDRDLQSLNLGNHFDTSKVANMSNMFGEDSALQSLNLGNKFDTSQVSDMNSMFKEDSALQSLNLGNKFDTSQVSDMSSMFGEDSALQSLNLGNKFDTSKVTDMSSMFNGDSALQSLNLGNKFDTSKVIHMSDIFNGNSALQSLTIKSSNSKFSTIAEPPILYKTLVYKNQAGIPYTESKPNDFSQGNIGTYTKENLYKATICYRYKDKDGKILKSYPKSDVYGANEKSDIDNKTPFYYHIINGTDNQFLTNNLNHNTIIVIITPNQVTDTINYIYNGQKLSTDIATGNDAQANGASDTSFSINNSHHPKMPADYHLVNNDNTFNYDGGTYSVQVEPNSATDTINYQYKDKILSTHQFQGNSVQASGASDTNFSVNNANDPGIPANYHLVNADNTFNYDNGTHSVQVEPNSATATIKYQYTDKKGNKYTFNGKQFSGNAISATKVNDNPITVPNTSVTISNSNQPNMPQGYQLVNNNSNRNIPFDNKLHIVAITPIQQTDIITFMNGNKSVGTIITTGNDSRTGINGTSTVNLPARYQLAKGASNTVANDGNTHTINITPISETNTINYQYKGKTIASTTSSGNDVSDTKFNINNDNHPNIPAGYHLIYNNNPFVYNDSSDNVAIAPNPSNATIHYQYKGKTIGSHTFSGNDYRATQAGNNSVDVNKNNEPNMPTGYQLINDNNRFNYDGKSDDVAITPIQKTDTINYQYKGKTIASTTSSGNDVSDTPININNDNHPNMPTGYQLINDNNRFNYDGDTHNVPISKDVTITIYFRDRWTHRLINYDNPIIKSGMSDTSYKISAPKHFTLVNPKDGSILNGNNDVNNNRVIVKYNNNYPQTLWVAPVYKGMTYRIKGLGLHRVMEFVNGTAQSNLSNFMPDAPLFFKVMQGANIKFDNNVDTSKVTNMSNMFKGDIRLRLIDFGDNFNTNNVKNMNGMFQSDTHLQSLKLGNNFGNNEVKDMSNMFKSDTNLQSLDLGNNFGTSRVSDMSNMFQNDTKLQSLKFGNNFNTNQVKNMNGMFQSDANLKSLDLGNDFGTSQVSDMSNMFQNDTKLQSLDLGNNFGTSRVNDMSNMFQNDTSLQSLKLGNNFDNNNVTNMNNMFRSDTNLQSLDLSNNFGTSQVSDMSNMFQNDKDLQSLKLSSNFNTGNVKNMSNMFKSDNNLNEITINSPATKFNPDAILRLKNSPISLEQSSDGSSDIPIKASNSDKDEIKKILINNINMEEADSEPNVGQFIYDTSGGYSDDYKDALYNSDQLEPIPISSDPKYKHIYSIINSNKPALDKLKIERQPVPFYKELSDKDSNGKNYTFATSNDFTDGNIGTFIRTPNPAINIHFVTKDNINNSDVILVANDVSVKKRTSNTFTIPSVPDGYVLSKSQPSTILLNNKTNTYTVHVTPKSASVNINYQYDGNTIKSSSATGAYGTSSSISNCNISGWHLANDGTQNIEFNNISDAPTTNSSVNVNILPNQATDTINYEYNGKTLASHQFSGNDYRATAAGDTYVDLNSDNARIPSGYHLLCNNKFFFDGDTHIVQIKPNQVTDIINYEYNGSQIGSSSSTTGNDYQAKSASDTSFKVTSMPANYHIASSASSEFNYDGNNHTVSVAPNSVTNTITFSGDNNYNSSVSGLYNAKGSVSAPSGYHYISNNTGSFNYGANNTNHTFDVAPNSATEDINYIYNNGTKSFNEGSTSMSGSYNESGDITSANAFSLSSGYQLSSANNSFTYSNGSASFDVNVVPKSASTIVNYQYNNSTKGSQTFNGNNQYATDAGDTSINITSTTKGLNLPAGYQLVNLTNNSIPYDNGKHPIAITPIQQTDNIQFMNNGQQVGTTTTKGNDSRTGINGNSTVILPVGYQLAKGASTSVTNDGKAHQINVIPIHLTDTINYQLNGKTIGTHKFSGNDSSAQGASDTSFDVTATNDPDMPQGYQLVNKDNNFSYDGGTHDIAIAPNTVSDVITFKGNNYSSTSRVSGLYHTTGSISAPKGYHFTDGKSKESFTYGNNNTTFSVVSDTSTITINYVNNGKVINSTKITKPVSTNFDIGNYLSNLPRGYECSGIKNDVDNFDYNNHTVDILLNKVSPAKVPNGNSNGNNNSNNTHSSTKPKSLSTITVNYVNKANNHFVRLPQVFTHTVGTSFDASALENNIPKGYVYSGISNPNVNSFTKTDQTIDILLEVPKTNQPKHTSDTDQGSASSSKASSASASSTSSQSSIMSSKAQSTSQPSTTSSNMEPYKHTIQSQQASYPTSTKTKHSNIRISETNLGNNHAWNYKQNIKSSFIHKLTKFVHRHVHKSQRKLPQTNEAHSNASMIAAALLAMAGIILAIGDLRHKHSE